MYIALLLIVCLTVFFAPTDQVINEEDFSQVEYVYEPKEYVYVPLECLIDTNHYDTKCYEDHIDGN